jgi:hypothetical protein
MWCSRSVRVKPARLLAHAASQVCFCGRVYLHSCQCRIPGRTWVHLLELAELRSRVGQKAYLRRQWRPSLSAAGRTATALRSRPWLRWNGLLRALESLGASMLELISITARSLLPSKVPRGGGARHAYLMQQQSLPRQTSPAVTPSQFAPTSTCRLVALSCPSSFK